MTSILAPAVRRTPARPAAVGAPGRRLKSLARAATGLACGALADVGEMLVVSLLTAGAAAAAACALASLAVWIAKALAAIVVQVPAQALARRMAVVPPTSSAGAPIAGTLQASGGVARRRASSNSAPANRLQPIMPRSCQDSCRAMVLPRSRASPETSMSSDGT